MTLRPAALGLLLLASTAAISQTGTTNNPYTATRKSTFIQKLTDGTMITRTSTGKEARDSQGRTMQQNDLLPPDQKITHTFVSDPVARTTTSWITPGREASRLHLPESSRVPNPPAPVQPGMSGMGSGSVSGVIGIVSTSADTPISHDPNLRPTRQTEKLGNRQIAGVNAEGTRYTTTYPIGFFGNDRPLITFHESWMSSELKLIVLSVDDDPRTGTRISEVTNLDRSEPDPALFQVPEGYTIKEQNPGSN